MARVPDTPEGVALALFDRIVKADPALITRSDQQPIAAAILNLFSECLEAASWQYEKRIAALAEQLSLRGKTMQ